MPVDNRVLTYANLLLTRAHANLDPKLIEDYLEDRSFELLVSSLDKKLVESFRTFKKEYKKPTSTTANISLPYESLDSNDSFTMHKFNDLSCVTPKPVVDTAQRPIAPLLVVSSVPAFQNEVALASLQNSTSLDVDQVKTTIPVKTSIFPPPSKIHSDKDDIRFVLKNARADESYLCKVTPEKKQARYYQFLDVIIPPELTLSFNTRLEEFSGIPTSVGNFDIRINYRFGNENLVRQAILKFTVTPNPKSMWKNLPSDRTDPYWKPDEDKKFIRGDKFDIVAASQRGRSHAHTGIFRDDDFRIEHLDESGWCVAIVSDGAGSCTFSRRGAQIICETSLNHILKSLRSDHEKTISSATENFHRTRNDNSDQSAFDSAKVTLRNALYETVSHAAHFSVTEITKEINKHPELKAKSKDFSSTALISISKKFEFGTLCAAYWVGDGAVGIYTKSKGITLLGTVDSGEFSGQTRFLDQSEVTSEALASRLRFELVEDFTAFILMSDGVSDPKFETEARLSRLSDWDELWNDLDATVSLQRDGETDEKAVKLLSWLDFWSQGNHDDRTIAIIY